MLILAHRGFHERTHENTMASFDAAVRMGVHGIETDVRLSADDKPVIIHDRVSPRGRAVAEIKHAELVADVQRAVPLLEEILDAFPDLLWNIEIKTPEAWTVAGPILGRHRAQRLL